MELIAGVPLLAMKQVRRSGAIFSRASQKNAHWQSNVAQNLEKIGDIKLAAGDSKGALTSYQEMLAIDRELVERDGSNIEWQRTLSLSLERMGDVRLALGHAMSAVTAYEESLAIQRRLIELDDSNIKWLEGVSYIIKKVDHAKRAREEQVASDHHLTDVEASTPLLARKESVLLSGEEASHVPSAHFSHFSRRSQGRELGGKENRYC
jgi:tetratricopeptide (TPR) repeat protein